MKKINEIGLIIGKYLNPRDDNKYELLGEESHDGFIPTTWNSLEELDTWITQYDEKIHKSITRGQPINMKLYTHMINNNFKGEGCSSGSFNIENLDSGVNAVKTYWKNKDLDVTLWISFDGTIVDSWDYKGTTSKDTLYEGDNIFSKGIFDKMEICLNKKFCTDCGTGVDEYAGSHFAGHYCSKCWKSYKKEHSRVCGMCKKPEWGCYC